jgi:DnaK suppressor protein
MKNLHVTRKTSQDTVGNPLAKYVRTRAAEGSETGQSRKGKRTEKSIDAIVEELRHKRAALLEEVAETDEDLQEIQQLRESEMEEQAQEDRAAKFLSRMSERKMALVKEIDAALTRIEKGEYGTCEECGEEIAWGRIRAVPFARTCIDCAEKLEKRRATAREETSAEENGSIFSADLTPLSEES